jgi:hypothetical protein
MGIRLANYISLILKLILYLKVYLQIIKPRLNGAKSQLPRHVNTAPKATHSSPGKITAPRARERSSQGQLTAPKARKHSSL